MGKQLEVFATLLCLPRWVHRYSLHKLLFFAGSTGIHFIIRCCAMLSIGVSLILEGAVVGGGPFAGVGVLGRG